jgi:hypothetical protein
MVVAALALGQRWSATRKRKVVIRIFRGDPRDLLSRELGFELNRMGNGYDPSWQAWRRCSRLGCPRPLKREAA